MLSQMTSFPTGFFAARRRDEKSTYPDMRFKSKFAPSNTIEVLARSLKKRDHNGLDQFEFHPVFFGDNDGIALHEKLSPISMSVRFQRLREEEYYLIVPRFKEFPQSKTTRVCAIDPGVRIFISVYDPDGRTFSVSDSRSVLKRRFEAIDEMKSILKLKDNECKEIHPMKVRTKTKKETKSPKAAEHRLRYRLRRRIRFTSRKATRAVKDMHQKLSSWLATNYYNVLLPSFQTSEMVRKHFEGEAADVTPGSSNEERVTTRQKRNIPSPTARSMLAQAHFKFKRLLKHKMERAGGRVVDCEEEYISKTCPRCGEIKNNLGGNHVYTCTFCHAVLDRDVSAATTIFHKNIGLLF
ncbi:hypothetical protein BBJ28_00004934 [Nothophytophthora sp. Chile5]|nr:hypothetical protein BBJ28_00004934 [Nothophytophthora sp. Chile5]